MRNKIGYSGLCFAYKGVPERIFTRDPEKPVTQYEGYLCGNSPSPISMNRKPVRAATLEDRSTNGS